MHARWEPGLVVGEYRLLARLGQGGMGAVDLALHLPTGARRAIKSIPASSDADLVLRFRREAEALARVDRHPGVVRVHALGTAHGRHYLVMDHLPGGDLERRLEQGPLAPAEAIRLGVALARALAHVHARGILHRDLKPSNVLFDEGGHPALVDFGLARALDARSLTVTGQLLGTPAYMAPEQALGDAAAVGPATDIYGLGAILYRALGGRAPAEGRSTIDVLSSVIEGKRPRLRDCAPGIPAALERVVERAMARSPADRFASAEDLARALEEARHQGDRGRRPTALMVGGALALALVAGGATIAAIAPAGAEPMRAASGAPEAAVTSRVPPPAAPDGPAAEPVAPVDGGRPRTVEDIGPVPERLPRKAQDLMGLSTFTSPLAGIGYLFREARSEEEWDIVARLLASVVRDPAAPDRAQAWELLGRLFLAGTGVAYDEVEARRCFEEASKLGHMGARRKLGTAYADGRLGLERDVGRAIELLASVAGRSRDEPGFDGHERDRAAQDLAWLVRLDPERERIDLAVKLLGPVGGAEAAVVRSLLRVARGDRDLEIAKELEVHLANPEWGGRALRELVAFHRAAGRDDAADEVLARVEQGVEAGDVARTLTYAKFLMEDPATVHLAPSLLERVFESDDLERKKAAGLSLLALARHDVRSGRQPPVPIETIEERLRRLPNGEELLRDAR